ncbi:MAG TPA: poly-gamma-glutamate biosynthesis protein PgsC [Nitrososphaerales archaeon]|nr:poly-gamma-glutamate biosynthesis protein PgsC [Nitrososphaerales archaeon]
MVVYGVTLDTAEIAIAIGIAVSMIFYEKQALVPGGVIVPGYVALTLDRPYLLLSTFVVSIATLFVVKKLSNYLILFGRRKFSITMLVSFVMGWAIQAAASVVLVVFQVPSIGPSGIFQVIGFIIPGLVANSMERQGITKTMYALVAVSVITYVIVYAITGK